MLLIKTPVVLLAALGYALTVWIRRRGRIALPTAILCGYAVCFLLLAMRAKINIGVRHVLPMLPILTLLGGLGAASAWRALQGTRYRAPLVALAAGGSLFGVAQTFPDYVSDFNLLVGGRSGGHKVSIIGEEWGQDTLRLSRALRERGIRQIYYTGDSRLTRLEFAEAGIRSESLECDRALPARSHYAVRARDRARKRCHLWAADREPLFEMNGHVFVYRTD